MDKLLMVIGVSLGIFILLTILARIIGKKLLSQMTFYDLVVAITIGTIGGAFISNVVKGPLVLLSPVILTLCAVALGYMGVRNITLSKLTEGEPIVVIQNGKILEKNMARTRYNLTDLQMQLRIKDIFDMRDVEFAILEPNGQLSVLKKTQKLPVTPSDLHLPTTYVGLPTTIIRDGDVIEQNLQQNGLDMEWLKREMDKMGVKDLKQVLLCSLNTDGSFYVDLRESGEVDYVQEVEDAVDEDRPRV